MINEYINNSSLSEFQNKVLVKFSEEHAAWLSWKGAFSGLLRVSNLDWVADGVYINILDSWHVFKQEQSVTINHLDFIERC